MVKEVYEMPQADVIVIEVEDVITSSEPSGGSHRDPFLDDIDWQFWS